MMSKDIFIQALRGLAIAAVVLIHCLPHHEATIFIRPFLNWGVAMFLFLSGMLSSKSKFTRGGGVVRKRLSKTLAPYVLWSVFYFVALGNGNPLILVKDLVTGAAAAQMYYLLVYAQLVVLTPLLYRLLKSYRVILYAVTPAILIVREACAWAGYSIPYLSAFFATWLIYYLLGLEWKRIQTRLSQVGMARIVIAAALAMAFQLASAAAWNAYGNFDIATSQLKLTSMASSICIIALLMLASGKARNRLASCRLIVHLGNASFGIYLSHIAVLAVVQKVFGMLGLVAFGWVFAIWFAVLALSHILVIVSQRVLPQKALSTIGFV